MSTLSTPLRWETAGRFAIVEGDDADAQLIGNILGTRCSTIGDGGKYIPGEIPWRPDFGSKLAYLAHKMLPESTLRDLARSYAIDALRRWAPHLRVTRLTAAVEVQPDQANKITITLWYQPIDSKAAPLKTTVTL